MPRVVKVGENREDAACVCVGYGQTKATQRKCCILSTGNILCVKKYVPCSV